MVLELRLRAERDRGWIQPILQTMVRGVLAGAGSVTLLVGKLVYGTENATNHSRTRGVTMVKNEPRKELLQLIPTWPAVVEANNGNPPPACHTVLGLGHTVSNNGQFMKTDYCQNKGLGSICRIRSPTLLYSPLAFPVSSKVKHCLRTKYRR